MGRPCRTAATLLAAAIRHSAAGWPSTLTGSRHRNATASHFRRLQYEYLLCEDGPAASNDELDTCSTWHGTLEEATLRCQGQPGCSILHDYGCDGTGYRFCTGPVEALQGADAGACLKVCSPATYTATTDTATTSWTTATGGATTSRTATTTTTSTTSRTATTTTTSTTSRTVTAVGSFHYSFGLVDPSHCSDDASRLPEARRRCSRDPDCSVLLDLGCDGEGWRVCKGPIGVVSGAGAHLRACTLVRAQPAARPQPTDTSLSDLAMVCIIGATSFLGMLFFFPLAVVLCACHRRRSRHKYSADEFES